MKSPILPTSSAEELVRQLISELEQLDDPNALASWAQRALPLKNKLAVANAQALEAAFAHGLARLATRAPIHRLRMPKGTGRQAANLAPRR